jgi:nucleotide-binding universal stress UspA family protein
MMGQRERIVVGYDGSRQAIRALEWAAAEAVRRGEPLTVLYVIDYGRFVTGGDNSGGVGWATTSATDSARLLVDKAVEQARTTSSGLQVDGQSTVGRPIGALIEASRTARLLVLGTRGHGTLRDLFTGSVAETVAAHAWCPVVIVRGDAATVPGPAHAVVVGVDGSAASRAAVEYAAGTAKECSAPLVVVSAWNDVARYSRWVSVDSRVVIDRDALLVAERRAASHALEAAVADVRARYPGVAVTPTLLEGAPGPALLRAGADAGLVVVGTRGHGALAGLLLRSVSQAVVHGSRRPVAVVRAARRTTISTGTAVQEPPVLTTTG